MTDEKINPRNELKTIMTTLLEIKERIRDIEIHLSTNPKLYTENTFTIIQLDKIEKGLDVLTKEVFNIEGIKTAVFTEYNIKEKDLKKK